MLARQVDLRRGRPRRHQGPAAQDPDPRVQQAAVTALAMLDFDHAEPALAAMETNRHPRRRRRSQGHARTLTRYRKLNRI
jgi:hypothetical protein